MSTSHSKPGPLLRWLARLERVGNAMPDPATLFLLLAAVVVGISALCAGSAAEVMQRDGSSAVHTVRSLLSRDGIAWMLQSAVQNFVDFAPLGPVLTVMLGIGVAERSGLITTGLRLLVGSVPPVMITCALVAAGVLSSMVADAGYVVLTPLGALLFLGLGRHPLAGLAATFAGVSGGYSANLLITSLDPMLARLTGQAAQSLDPLYRVQPTGNYYFMIASTFLITLVGTWVTTRIVEPMLGPYNGPTQSENDADAALAKEPSTTERQGALWALLAAICTGVGLYFLAFAKGAPLRAEHGDVMQSLLPAFDAVEVLMALFFIVPGIVFGMRVGTIRNDKDVAKMAADTMSTMGAYVVLAFVAGQFVAYFNWTHLGSVAAVKGAGLLQAVGLTGTPLLLAFVLVSASMNFLVGSASAKWAFMAPIFVPMLMMMGFSPEATQAAYRVGDSVTNIIAPLMPYLPIIIVFAQRFDPKAGLGTLVATMTPYACAFAIAWSIMLIAWLGFDLPLGPGVSAHYIYGATP